MTLKDKKILMVVAPEGFKDDECFIPKKIFEKEGILIQVASLSEGEAMSEKGAKLRVDFAADEVRPNHFDAVVFVGGPGMAKRVKDPSFVDLARDFHTAGKLTTAICIAPVVLANAGLLVGKRATVSESGQMDIEDMGAEYTGEKVTATDNIITASGPAVAEEFAKAVVRGL